MKKSFKLALLGCTASCLMSVAYANTSDAEVIPASGLEISSAPFQAVACGAEARDVPVTFTNKNRFRPIVIDNAKIFDIIGEDLGVEISVNNTCDLIRGGDSCDATVTVDPSNAECGPLGYIDYERIISRLVVGYHQVNLTDENTAQLASEERELASLAIRFPVTLLGSAGNYSIIGGNIQVGSDDSVNTLDNSVTTVEQDITAGDDHINVANGSYINYMEDSEYVKYDNGGSNAFLDAYAAYSALSYVIFGNIPSSSELKSEQFEFLQCEDVAQTLDFSRTVHDNLSQPSITIPSGFYCAIGDYCDPEHQACEKTSDDANLTPTLDFYIGTELTFVGDLGDPVVIAFPDYDGVDTTLHIEDGASYVLNNNGGISLPISFEDIVWLVDVDQTYVNSGSEFVGTILSTKKFTSLPSNGWENGTPYFYGRLLGLYSDQDCCQNGYDSDIFLDGITFDNGNIL